MINPTEFIKKHRLGSYRISGEEIELGCPFKECPNHKQKQFYINSNNGAWVCHRCGKKGINLKRLEFALGYVELKEPVKANHVYIPEREINKFHSDLWNSEDALSYLRNQRGFEDWVLKQFRLGYRIKDGNEVIVIPYFDKIGACVGMKYDFFKRPAGIAQKYMKEKGTKTQFFNLDNIDLKQPLIVTEGEYDAISGYQYGLENIGSVPNGATAINGWIDEISEGEKFILCFDNDGAGTEGASRFSKQVGKAKCFRVYSRCKDLSEALQTGFGQDEVLKWFKDEHPMFDAPVMDVTSYVDKAKAVIENPEQYKGTPTGWDVFDYLIKGIRGKEVTAVSGKTGNGKTTWGVSLIGNLIKRDVNCLLVSPEMREEKLLLMLVNNHFRRQATAEEIEMFVDKHKGSVHLANMYGSWTEENETGMMDLLFDIMQYSVKNSNIKFVFIDHLRLFTSCKEDQERKEIDEFMKRCVRFAMIYDVHIMVVVQPRKLEKGQRKVTGNDLKGSVNIEQDAHNILLVHREEDSDLVEFDLEKNREFGSVGSFKLKFNKESMANYEEINN